ncbi:MAG TPA: PRD domain-containing protein [Lachnospiraceae bacterium]|nr:PRD domain-containing protein [Lachnospiraceae bacterium]
MKVDKIINNNIVSSIDNQGKEIVVMGRGLGFKCKAGDDIDETKIEKIFRMSTHAESEQLQNLLAEIPLENIQVSNDIITFAKSKIEKKFNKNIYITLTDHINFAIERYREGMNFKNALLWEIKRIYPLEFSVGEKALSLINEKVGIELPEDEAASIAMHFVNAEFDTQMPHTIDMTKMIQNVLKIVTYHFQKTIDESTYNFERFIIHLRFFAQRVVNQKSYSGNDLTFCNMVNEPYANEYKCAQKIGIYIRNEYNIDLSEEEMAYLTIHIKRITS